MVLAIAVITALWSIDNAEFIDTMNKQIAEGFRWNAIECRHVNPDLPAITIKAPTGNEFVCHKLK
tara:strand:- start:57 stop:251 length:195 start_codon:yes stop_codon:yes gene_type:complete